MCRAVAYLGEEVILSQLISDPDNSLFKQSFSPELTKTLNLAGFGMGVWSNKFNHPQESMIYRTLELPVYDQNLIGITKQINISAIIAHIRGTPLFGNLELNYQNLHPFFFPNAPFILAHNGLLEKFEVIKYDLVRYVRPEYSTYIRGTTDTEWIYAMILSQIRASREEWSIHHITEALCETIEIIGKVRQRHGIQTSSPLNLFLTNGEWIIATRFYYDFGCYESKVRSTDLTFTSLWYTLGERFGFYDGEYKMIGHEKTKSILIASEPLTLESSHWVELPEYSLMKAYKEEGGYKVELENIEIK